jgi:hypothetical protein
MLQDTAARSGFPRLSVGLPKSLRRFHGPPSREGEAVVNRLLITKCLATETKGLIWIDEAETG